MMLYKRKVFLVLYLVLVSVVLVGCAGESGDVEVGDRTNHVADIVEMLEEGGLTLDHTIGYDADRILETETRIEVDGEILQFDERFSNVGGDARTITYDDRTLVPLREISGVSGFGIEVEAGGKKPVLSIVGKDYILKATLNSNEFWVESVDGKNLGIVYSTTPTIRHNGTLYVPVRFMSAFLGFDVEWDSGREIVVLTNKGNRGIIQGE